MQFRILGPMEVLDGDRSLALGGIKQRATLGYLLLHANRVVATSQLIGALWSVEDAPFSARKILQNAVWGLRRELNGVTSSTGATGATALDTRSPGYRLTVDPEDVDLFRFHRRADEGRAHLAAGEPERAARVLRDALEPWRGPVLADLVEAGIDWPELAAAQNAQWNVMEDYFHAELACGHHLAVLEELESMVARTALRERSSGQLMLALYRSGRQADALGVYTRVRTTLVEGFGLEPGRELQNLQRAILAHDDSLLPPGTVDPWELDRRDGALSVVPAPEAAVVRRPAAMRATAGPTAKPTAGPDPGPGVVLAGAARSGTCAARSEPPPPKRSAALSTASARQGHVPSIPVQRAPGRDQQPLRDDHLVARAKPGHADWHVVSTDRGEPETRSEPGVCGEPETRSEPGVRGEREPMSVLMLRACPGVAGATADPLRLDDTMADIGTLITDGIEYYGGRVSATHGPVSLALFGGRGQHADAAECAVLASLTIGDELRARAAARTGTLDAGLSLRAAVVSGEALVRHRLDDGSPVAITGPLLDRGRTLLAHAREGEIRVCGETRRATRSTVAYRRSDRAEEEWVVGGVRRDTIGHVSLPLVDREFELGLLRGLEQLSRQRSHAQLVTVLGEAGTGKSRLLAEFERRVVDLVHLASHRVPAPAPVPAADGRDRRDAPTGAGAGSGANGVHAIQCEMVNALCGIRPDDPPQRQMDKLLGAFRRMVDDADERLLWLKTCLVPFLHPHSPPAPRADPTTQLTEWRTFLEHTELSRPLVLVVDGLDRADDEVLDFVDGLVGAAGAPLFVVVSAGPQLLRRRPGWGGGKRHATTVTLEALSDPAVDELVDFLLSPAPGEHRGAVRWLRRQLTGTSGRQPHERRRFIRTLLGIGIGVGGGTGGGDGLRHPVRP